MTIEKYRLVNTTFKVPVMRSPNKMAIAVNVDSQEYVLMRVVNIEQLQAHEIQAMKVQAAQYCTIKSSIILRLDNFFQEDRYFIYIYEYFPFQAVNLTDKSTQLCLLAMCDYLDDRFIAVEPLDLMSFGMHEGVVKIIPPFKLTENTNRINRARMTQILNNNKPISSSPSPNRKSFSSYISKPISSKTGASASKIS